MRKNIVLPNALKKCASCQFYKRGFCKNKVSKIFGVEKAMDSNCKNWNNPKSI